jgi:hypothetical protein
MGLLNKTIIAQIIPQLGLLLDGCRTKRGALAVGIAPSELRCVVRSHGELARKMVKEQLKLRKDRKSKKQIRSPAAAPSLCQWPQRVKTSKLVLLSLAKLLLNVR